MRKLLLLFSTALVLASCKKEANKPSKDADKYFFNYTINGKTGGYAFATAAMEVYPESQWWALGATGAGKEVISGTYPDIVYGKGVLVGNTSLNGIYASLSEDCNVSGRPPCFRAGVRLDKLTTGTFTIANGLETIYVYEAEGTPSASGFFFRRESAQPDESMTVTISSVGEWKGLIKGEFNGKVLSISGQLINVSGKFSVINTP